jgi:anthranilate phosphoribosyltransferase
MQNVLNNLVQRQTLSKSEAEEIIYAIVNGKLSSEHITGLMVAMQARGITLDEIAGFRKALLNLAIVPDIDATNAIDLCGTGGDGKNTFNISTTTAFVLASMGYKVIKHGNYGVSSMCGSSTVLEAMGVTFTNDSKQLEEELTAFNLCFLHAPLFHPALKEVAQMRKGLGIPTFFNIMGPLVNPVQPDYQLTGTFSLNIARMYHHLLQNCRKNYKIIFTMDGYDEISLTDDTRIFGKQEDAIFHPSQLHLKTLTAESLAAGVTIEEAVQIVQSILQGKGTAAQHRVVCSNSAHAIQTIVPSRKLDELFQEVDDHLKSGKPYELVTKFLNK